MPVERLALSQRAFTVPAGLRPVPALPPLPDAQWTRSEGRPDIYTKPPQGGTGGWVPEESSLNQGLDGTLRASVLRVGLLFSTRNDAGGKPAERARRRACRVSFSDATGSQVSCSPLDPWFVLADPSALDRGRWRLP